MNTYQRSPGVYVIDERPLSRPMTQASLGGCAMICQLTLADNGWEFKPAERIHRLSSADQFASLVGSESLLATLALASGFGIAEDGKYETADKRKDTPELRAARFRDMFRRFDPRHAANTELRVYTGAAALT